MVVGVIGYWTALSVISSCLRLVDAPADAFRDKVEFLCRYSEKRQLHEGQTAILRQYLRSIWHRFRGECEGSLMEGLPLPVKHSILHSFHVTLLQRVPIFTHSDPHLIHTLALHLQPRLYPADAILFNREDPGQRLYVLHGGKVEICRESATVEDADPSAFCSCHWQHTHEVLSGKHYFGLSNFLSQSKQSYAVRAVEDSNVYILSKESLYAVVGLYDPLQRRIIEAQVEEVSAAPASLALSPRLLPRPLPSTSKAQTQLELELSQLHTSPTAKKSVRFKDLIQLYSTPPPLSPLPVHITPKSPSHGLVRPAVTMNELNQVKTELSIPGTSKFAGGVSADDAVLSIGNRIYYSNIPSTVIMPIRVPGQDVSLPPSIVNELEYKNWFISSANTDHWLWQLLMLVVICSNGLLVPTRIAFIFIAGSSVGVETYAWDFVLDAVALLYVLSRSCFGTAAISRRQLIMEWFASIPFDLLAFATGRDSLPMLRLNRVLWMRVLTGRLQRCWTAGASGLPAEFSIRYRTVRMLLMALFAAQYVSCLWFSLAQLVRYSGDGAWLSSIADDTFGQSLRSFYWSITALTGTGIGDLIPYSTAETVFTVLVALIFYLLYPALLATIVGMNQSRHGSRTRFEKQLHMFQMYASIRGLSKSLLDRLERHFLWTWRLQQHPIEDDFLESLPESIRADVILHFCENQLRKIPPFQALPSAFFRSLAETVRVCAVASGETVLRKGELCTHLILVHRGRLAAGTAGESRTFDIGSCIGDNLIFNPSHKNRFSVLSVTDCELLCISKSALDATIARFPSIYQFLQTTDPLEIKRRTRANRQPNQTESPSVEAACITVCCTPSASSCPLMVSAVLLYHTIFAPFRVVLFDVDRADDAPWISVAIVLWVVLEYSLDGLVWMEAYKFRNQRKVVLFTNRLQRLQVYLDRCSLLPLDLLAWIWIDSNRVMFMWSLFRLIRLLRLFNLASYAKPLLRVLRRSSFGKFRGYIRLIRLVVSFVVAQHILACCWSFLRNFDDIGGGDDTVTERYLRSLYFVLSSMVNIGYGDVRPVSRTEVAFTVLIMLLGGAFIANLVGELASLFDVFDPSDLRSYRDLSLLNRFRAESTGFPTSFSLVQSHAEVVQNRLQGLNEAALWVSLPDHLRIDLCLEISESIISTPPSIFANCSEPFRRAVAGKLVPATLPGGVPLLRKGQAVHAMYLLLHGSVRLYANQIYKSIQGPCIIAQEQIFSNENSDDSTVTDSICELLVLSKVDLQQLCETHPDQYLILSRDIAGNRFSVDLTGASTVTLPVEQRVVSSDFTLVVERKSRFHNQFNMFSTLLVLSCVIYQCVVIPFRVVFAPDSLKWDYSRFIPWFIVDLILELVFLIDLLSRIRTCVTSRVTRSLKSSEWVSFGVDLILLIPVNILMGTVSTTVWCNLFKTIRVRRLADLRVLLNRTYPNPSRNRLVFFVFLIPLLLHWIACVWFSTSFMTELGPTWVDKDGIAEADNHRKYIRSLYWTVTTVTTVGFGDIVALRPIEVVVAVAVMWISLTVLVMTLGMLIDIWKGKDLDLLGVFANGERLARFIKTRGVPPLLARRTQRAAYVSTLWSQGHFICSVLGRLPDPLRDLVALEVHGSRLRSVSMFASCPDPILARLGSVLQPLVFESGEFIYTEGSSERSMYFIESGSVVISKLSFKANAFGNDNAAANQHKSIQLGPGSHFGCENLFFAKFSANSAQALSRCNVYVLSDEALRKVLGMYPEIKARILRRASTLNGSQLI
eukprot:GILJ01007064.1.p1 GENE.GILJ01007064.1~~GILJ01007064.1.p1  ORF type:complete len:1989 (+),score=236.28 GILJ01007064.1:694-5967(+)